MQAQQISRAFMQPLLLSVPKLPPAETQLFEMRVYTWAIALEWVCKMEWQPKHKISCKRPLAKLLKPRGIFLQHIYWLCKECHAAQQITGQGKSPYDNALQWFEAIFYEILEEGVVAVQNAAIDPPQISIVQAPQKAEDKKRLMLRSMYRTATHAAAHENPFQNCQTKPASALLIETAISMANCSQVFRNRHYRPFIGAWRSWIKSMESPDFKRYFIKEGVLYSQAGRGRHAKNLSRGYLAQKTDF